MVYDYTIPGKKKYEGCGLIFFHQPSTEVVFKCLVEDIKV